MNIAMKCSFAITLLLQIQIGITKIHVFPADTFEPCNSDDTSTFIDFSEVEYEYVNDTEFFLTGSFELKGF